MSHKLKSQRWKHGVLETKEFFFDTLEQALFFASSIDIGHTVKIYDENQQLTHHLSGPGNIENLYA
jgi:hypothetical protein